MRLAVYWLFLAVSMVFANERYGLDTSFKFGSDQTSLVEDLVLMPDGRIAFAGNGPTFRYEGSFGLVDSSGKETPSFGVHTVAHSLALTEDYGLLVARLDARSGSMAITRFYGPHLDVAFWGRAQVSGEVVKVVVEPNSGEITIAGRLSFGVDTNKIGRA